MTFHSANRSNSVRLESISNLPQSPKTEQPEVKAQAGNTPPAAVAARGKGMQQRLLKSASTGALPGQTKVAEQNKVASKEKKEEGSNKQGGKNSDNRDGPAISSQPRAERIKPASKPDIQPANNEDRGHPFIDLIGKFGQFILNGMEMVNKLLEQVTEMAMATFRRASKSADEYNKL
ncbi:hypothetical protein [Actimicrobium sp. CCI2.3]|uniref:hypothetical protein n=1 Tax=Actimicrobium sp. CCI2.3 TaxID=3048616 RepID=UPI002AB56CA8|nr:hypothetical protein [Actimicrobium sp. CCI2.3]MDY7574029.1 hypothetical protein [Actimicrobium sp. CCI2.3]MEB0021863.1 hypothetical protein [Actimicrobium sp. CCI2.3]